MDDLKKISLKILKTAVIVWGFSLVISFYFYGFLRMCHILIYTSCFLSFLPLWLHWLASPVPDQSRNIVLAKTRMQTLQATQRKMDLIAFWIVSPENSEKKHDTSLSCNLNLACRHSNMKQKEKADPFSLGQLLPKTTTADHVQLCMHQHIYETCHTLPHFLPSISFFFLQCCMYSSTHSST